MILKISFIEIQYQLVLERNIKLNFKINRIDNVQQGKVLA